MESSAVIEFMVSKGWSEDQAAGIAANLKHESNFNAGAVGDGGKAYGLAQWHEPRQDAFKSWAGKSIKGSSEDEQLEFIHHELTAGSERAAGNKLRLAASAHEAGDVFSRAYERPSKTEEEAAARGATAARLLGQAPVSRRMARGIDQEGNVIGDSRPVAELRKGGNAPTRQSLPAVETNDGLSPFALGQSTMEVTGVQAAAATSRSEQAAKDAQPWLGSLYEKDSTIGAAYQAALAPEIRLIDHLLNGFPEPDAAHTAYMRDNVDKEVAPYTDKERELIYGSVSADDLVQQKFKIAQDRENALVMSRSSTGGQLAAGLIAGIMSPTTLATGVAAGSVMAGIGVGASALIKEGRPVAAAISTAVEGSLGNVAYDAALHAMGEQRSINDYIVSASTGLAMGALMSPVNYRAAVNSRAALLAKDAAERKATLVAQAAKDLGAEATPEAIAQRAAMAETEALRAQVADQRAVPADDRIKLDPVADTEALSTALAEQAAIEATVEPKAKVVLDDSTRPTSEENLSLWENGILAEVNTVADLQKYSAQLSKSGAYVDPRAKAIYEPSDDRVYLVRENLTPAELANPAGLIAHEVGVHYGLERTVGVEKFRKIIGDIENSQHPDAVAARKAVPENTPAYLRGEEMLGYLAEKANSRTINKVVAYIRNWLRDNVGVFKDMVITRDDALAYIRGSVERARKSRITQDATFPYVWHGNAVPGLDQFDLRFAGTGEGVAAFGHGHYMTSERQTAIGYRGIATTRRGMPSEEGGLYRMKLEGSQADYFDWDNKLPSKFTDRFEFAEEGMTGKKFYQAAVKEYGSAVAASTALSEAGVRGHRYATGRTRKGTGVKNSNYVVYSNPDVKVDVRYSFGTELMPETTPEEKATKKLVEETIDNAIRWDAAHPTDPVKLRTIMDTFGLATPGQLLASSGNPVARWVAGTLLEHTMGASGRRSTAAIRSRMLDEGYIGNAVLDFEQSYVMWRNETVGVAKGFSSDVADLKVYDNFNRKVMELKASREQGYPIQAHPMVVKAADALEGAYTRMLVAQKVAKTTGWAVLPTNSVGYFPRSLDAGKIVAASVDQLTAYKDMLSRQMVSISGFDSVMAEKVARAYLDHARVNAAGGHEIPANIYDPAASGYVQSALKAVGLTHDQIMAFEKKLASGGASHTKKKLQLDLNESATLPNGTTVVLSDLYKTDMSMLLRNQSKRVAGEVALAEQGIMGSAGMAIIERALQFGDHTKGTMLTADQKAAFQQGTAELLGKPYGDAIPQGVDALITATAQAGLGGMGITQIGESITLATGLGVSHLLNFVGSAPRLLNEVRTLSKGGTVVNPVLSTMELPGGTGEWGMQGYKMVTAFDNPSSVNEVVGRSAASPLVRLLRKTGQAFKVATMHRLIEAIQRRGVAEQITIKALRLVRDGANDVRLESMGIDSALSARLRNDLPNAVVWDGDRVKSFDIRKFKDIDAARDFAVAIRRGSGQLIQETFAGEAGFWQHKTLGKVLSQFRNYPLLAMEKQWGRTVAINGGGVQGAAVATAVLIAAAGMALPLHLARLQLNALGRSDREEYLTKMMAPDMLGKAVLNYVAVSGLANDFAELTKSAADVVSGDATGKATVGSFIPAVGYVENVLGAMRDPHDPKKWSRIMPLGNTPLIGPLFNLWASD